MGSEEIRKLKEENGSPKEINKPGPANEQQKSPSPPQQRSPSPPQRLSQENGSPKEMNKGPVTTNEQPVLHVKTLQQTEVLLKSPQQQNSKEKETPKDVSKGPVTFIEETVVKPSPSPQQPQSQGSPEPQRPQQVSKLSTFYTAGPFSASSINGVLQVAIDGRPINIQQAKLISEDAQTKTLQPLEFPEARIILPKNKSNVIILEYKGYTFETTDNGKERIFTTRGHL